MPEESAEDLAKKITGKATEAKKVVSTPDICDTPSPAGPVPVPYPNTANMSDAKTGSNKVKTTGNLPLTKESSYKKSSGDEPGSCNMDRIKKLVNLRIAKIPLWIWGFSIILLLVAVWVALNSFPSLEPVEPIEFHLNH